jgi:hypothetical protein
MQTRNTFRHRAVFAAVSVVAFLTACGGGDETIVASEGVDAEIASENEGIAGIYAAGGGDLSILHLGDPSVNPNVLADDESNGGQTRMRIANAGIGVLPIDSADWSQILAPVGTKGDSLPLNTPAHWDWAQRSVMHAGNQVPRGFTMQIGWGHVLNTRDAGSRAPQLLEVRSHRTFVCSRINGQVRWLLSQTGDVDGAAFRADFAGNANRPATKQYLDGDAVRVGFPHGMAYHFWSRSARQPIPSGYCGLLVLAEARAVQSNGSPLASGTRPSILLALGADYWLNKSVGWDHQRTNRSVGTGRLRFVSGQWDWHGFRTASDADIAVFRRDGAR